MDSPVVRLENECRELLLDAGSDPLAEYAHPGDAGSFLQQLACEAINGVSSRYRCPNVNTKTKGMLQGLSTND